jgi:hypothetical protein
MVSDYPSPNRLQLIACYEYRAIARHWQQGNVLYKRRHLFKNVNYATDVNLKSTRTGKKYIDDGQTYRI